MDDCVVDELGHFSPRLGKQHRSHNCRRSYGEAYASQTTERRRPYLIGEDEAQDASSQLEQEDQGEEHTELDGGAEGKGTRSHRGEEGASGGNTKAALLHSLLHVHLCWRGLEAGWFRGRVV